MKCTRFYLITIAICLAAFCVPNVNSFFSPQKSVASRISDFNNTKATSFQPSGSRFFGKSDSLVANDSTSNNYSQPSLQDGDAQQNDIVSATFAGLAVSLAMVPEAIAFAFVAGVNPLVGLWTTVILGFVAAALTGQAGICSSASGACSVVVASLCASKGPYFLSACAMLAGLFQVLGGILGLGKFIRLVPHPVMLGFVNGLALLMTRAQFVHLKGLSLNSPKGKATYAIVGITMLLVKLIPKVTKIIPPTLGAVVAATVLAKYGNLPVATLQQIAGASTFTGGWSVLPSFGLPAVPFTWATLLTILPYAATMAAVGSIESLLTMQLIQGLLDDENKSSTAKRKVEQHEVPPWLPRFGATNQECIAQGVGNVMAGLFGGIGGCALIGQSLINVGSGGGKNRWSGMSMAVFLGMGIVLAAPLLGAVPIASLVGVMLLVCFSTFSWSSLRLYNKIPLMDFLVIALVSWVTVTRDLAQAVVVGTVASALDFCWTQSTSLTVSVSNDSFRRSTTYRLNGPLFFGSTRHFETLLLSKRAKDDTTTIVLDFTNSRIYDHSALASIEKVAEKFVDSGKIVHLKHLSDNCSKLLSNMTKGHDQAHVGFSIIESGEDKKNSFGKQKAKAKN